MSVHIDSGSPMSRETEQCQVRVRLMSFPWILFLFSTMCYLMRTKEKKKRTMIYEFNHAI